VEASPQVSDNGDITFRSYERYQLEQNIALPRAVVAALDHGRTYSLYGIFAHHDGHGAPLQFVDSNPKPQQLKDGNRLVEQFSGRAVKANALCGIDTQLWETARGYLAIIRWRLTPIPLAEAVPGPFHAGADALPGDLVNCVLRVVRDKLGGIADANKGRGHKHAGVKLAAKRLAALAHADTTMSTEGFTLADTERLERDCEVRIRCLDVAGNDLLPDRPPATGRAARHLVVNVTLHDNHGWASLPVDPPAITTVRGYDDATEQAIELAGKTHPNDAEKVERAVTDALLDFVATSIPRGTRAWLCGGELVTHRGELYRSNKAARSLDSALEEFTSIHPQDLQDDAPAAVLLEHSKAVSSIGGASAYRFRKWLDREGIKGTPDKMRAIWEAAQV